MTIPFLTIGSNNLVINLMLEWQTLNVNHNGFSDNYINSHCLKLC